MAYKIALLPGDGVGPEIINEGVKVLKAVEEKYKGEISFEFETALIGGCAYDEYKTPLPVSTVELAKKPMLYTLVQLEIGNTIHYRRKLGRKKHCLEYEKN